MKILYISKETYTYIPNKIRVTYNKTYTCILAVPKGYTGACGWVGVCCACMLRICGIRSHVWAMLSCKDVA